MSNLFDVSRLIVLCLAFLSGACASTTWGRIGSALEGVAAGFEGAASATTRLLIFGGDNNRVFLGCLSCSEFDSDSVYNQYGDYGSIYSATSILNFYSEYGIAILRRKRL